VASSALSASRKVGRRFGRPAGLPLWPGRNCVAAGGRLYPTSLCELIILVDLRAKLLLGILIYLRGTIIQ
jgi:hypothetical protein